MKLYLFIFTIIVFTINLPSSLGNVSNGTVSGQFKCDGSKYQISFNQINVAYQINATCTTFWSIVPGYPHNWPYNLTINYAAPQTSILSYTAGGTLGLRAYVGVGTMTSGPCAGDLVANVAIFENTAKQCKCSAGVTTLRSVKNYVVIAGQVCGFNLCSGSEVNYFNPGIQNQ